ncbi:MAG: polysaccharide biosynthesis tyrosine autokinase [Nostocaceae cyanobacterium]|nr:polysaccharide biosynthesis tyrosine autokinase [Nostocaceae cyanobacterium]
MLYNQEEQDAVDLQRYSYILTKHWLVTATMMASVFGLTALVTFLPKPVYEAEGKLLFNKTNRASSLTGLDKQFSELSTVNQSGSPLDTEAELIRSIPMVRKTIDKFKLKDNKGKPLEIEDFLKKLKVKSVRSTDVLAVTYRSHNPQEAAAVVNTLISYYQENDIARNRTEARIAKEFLTKQLPILEARVEQAEAVLRRFKDENKVVSLEEEAKVGVEAVKDLSNQVIEAQAELEDATTRSRGLQSQLMLSTQQAVQFSTLSQSPGLQQVLTEYQKVQDELAVARTRLTDEHPRLKDLIGKQQALREQVQKRSGQIVTNPELIPEQNLQIGQLKQSLTQDLVKSEVDKLAAQKRVEVLQTALLKFQKRLQTLPKLEQRQRSLERKRQVAQSTYQQVLKQLQEVEVVERQQVGNAQIVSEALVPKKPVSPKILLNLALGGVLSVLIGIGTALMLEAMDKSLKTIEEAKQIFGYPWLGIIPRFKSPKGATAKTSELPVRDNPYSPVSAAFEMFQAKLDFSVSDKPLKVIVVVSSCPSEGSSFVAANLAVTKAHMGRRVLLIDGDMRHPRQQEIWNLSSETGLSNILVGKADLRGSAEEVLINLDVLTVGTIPPNPAALIDSQRMVALMSEAAKNYDYVIIDTPALNLFADGLMLGKLADGLLLVVSPGIVDTTLAQNTKTMIEQARSQVLGMVVNGVDSESGYYYSKNHYFKKDGDRNGKVEVKSPNISFS